MSEMQAVPVWVSRGASGFCAWEYVSLEDVFVARRFGARLPIDAFRDARIAKWGADPQPITAAVFGALRTPGENWDDP